MCWQLLFLFFSRTERSNQTLCAHGPVWRSVCVCVGAGGNPLRRQMPYFNCLGWVWKSAPAPGRGCLTPVGLEEGWAGARPGLVSVGPPRLETQSLRVALGQWIPMGCRARSCQGCTWLWVIPLSAEQRLVKHLSLDFSSWGSWGRGPTCNQQPGKESYSPNSCQRWTAGLQCCTDLSKARLLEEEQVGQDLWNCQSFPALPRMTLDKNRKKNSFPVISGVGSLESL